MLRHERWQLQSRREETVTTILVVDDEANLVELLDDYLSREGFQVLTAMDGLTALDLARARQPDLIVLDVMLPGDSMGSKSAEDSASSQTATCSC
jgi:DNA-binding response OmpR family regulator